MAVKIVNKMNVLQIAALRALDVNPELQAITGTWQEIESTRIFRNEIGVLQGVEYFLADKSTVYVQGYNTTVLVRCED